MDFTIPEEHVALGDLARTILQEHTAPDRLTQLEQDDGWLDTELWSNLADAGLLGLCLPEDVGGSGLDSLASHVLLREVGATAAHVPLFETTVLGARIVDRCATGSLRTGILEGVVSGTTILTAALEDELSGQPERPATVAEADGDDWILRGVKATVPVAPIADHLVVTATTSDGRTLVCLVSAGVVGLDVEVQRMPTDVPHGRVTFDGVRVPPGAVLAIGADADAALADLLDHARVGLASMQAGLVAQAVTLAATHTSTREQFGRAIATFQAVRQRVADARIASEMLSLTSLQAAWLLSEGRQAVDEVLIANWWAAEAGHQALHAVQHVHGGIGVDREYPLHRLFGRAKAHEFALGHGEQTLRTLGSRIAASVVDDTAA